MLKSLRFLPLAFLLFTAALQAQTLENVAASFDGEKMVITYDLNYSDPNQKFKVSLYSSHDNYARPLSLVAGDAGENVLPGKTNRIVWDAKNTLPADFDGDISIKVKASRIIPVAPVETVAKLNVKPLAKSGYKKGKAIDIQWTGGKPTDKYNIELYQNNVIKRSIAQKVDNTQKFTWFMDKENKKGKGYLIKVTNAANATETGNTQIFKIKPKVPFMVKFLLVAGVGAGVYLATLPKPTPIGPPDTGSDLPGLPDTFIP